MFNLLVTADGSAWEGSGRFRMERKRFKEYTSEQADFISAESPATLQALTLFDSILMYESGTTGETADRARIGRISDVQAELGAMTFRFEERGSVSRALIQAHAARLGITDNFEFVRTHWAIKDGQIPEQILSQVTTWEERPSALPAPPPDYDLVGLVDYLKAGLIAVIDGASMPPEEYRRIRRLLIGNPGTAALIPSYLRDARDPNEARDRVAAEQTSRQGQREHVRRTMNAIAVAVEGDATGELANYEYVSRLGEGGFGVVYRYRHRLLGEDFAVKVFAPAFNQWESANLERFFREARILLRLQHPSIVRFFEVGMFGRRPYLRTEFFDGVTMAEHVRDSGPMAPELALLLARRMTEALVHAHSQRVVHRDLKPQNVMIAVGSNEVRVIDFGLGLLVEDASRITKTGERAAGGVYTAPELLADPKLFDPVTDLYSLGAVWYTALTGQSPSAAGLARWADADEIEVPRQHRTIIRKCLDDRSRRFKSAEELLRRLEKL